MCPPQDARIEGGVANAQAGIVEVDGVRAKHSLVNRSDHGLKKLVRETLPAVEGLNRNVQAAAGEDLMRSVERQPIHTLMDGKRSQDLGTWQRAVDQSLCRLRCERDLCFACAAYDLLTQVFDDIDLGRGVLDDEATLMAQRASRLTALRARSLFGRDEYLVTLCGFEVTALGPALLLFVFRSRHPCRATDCGRAVAARRGQAPGGFSYRTPLGSHLKPASCGSSGVSAM